MRAPKVTAIDDLKSKLKQQQQTGTANALTAVAITVRIFMNVSKPSSILIISILVGLVLSFICWIPSKKEDEISAYPEILRSYPRPREFALTWNKHENELQVFRWKRVAYGYPKTAFIIDRRIGSHSYYSKLHIAIFVYNAVIFIIPIIVGIFLFTIIRRTIRSRKFCNIKE